MEGEPPLSRAEADHTARVQDHIGAAIAAAGGLIGFETYMNLALYAPGLGYYSAGAHKLGSGGDFTTAPEMSRLFGGCVAQQCAEVLSQLGAGSILEIGAGTGALAVDVRSPNAMPFSRSAPTCARGSSPICAHGRRTSRSA